jgi:hypothetical protein
MSARNELSSYVNRVERRLRLAAILRGAAILASAALITTLVLVLITNALAFSRWSVGTARLILLAVLITACVLGIAFPLRRLHRKSAADAAEKNFPQFKQRLVTFAERDEQSREPFLELLAADTLQIARDAEPKSLVPDRNILALMGVALASLCVLVWMIVAAPGYVGYGASLLWKGSRVGAGPFYDIRVNPGDASVRRNSDELITAQPRGLQTDQMRLYARYYSASKWEQVNMQPQPGGSGFQFLFAGLPEGVEYYVEAGAVKSKHFNIQVVDLPAVKQIRVTYHFPSWTGLKNVTDEHGGDLRAVEGTEADLDVITDRPLRDGLLVLSNGQKVRLAGGAANHYSGAIVMDKDGAYHVAAVDQGQPVRLSEDFFIEANKANPPEVQIVRPGRDYRASPIEEVTIGVKATDEFALKDLALHYSINGGLEQTANLLGKKDVKEADGSTTLYLENYKLVPGDIVSFYASAKDARAESHTDIFFIQADPFEREFSQSQQSAGGGGGGGQGGQSDISDREKEIIAATWKQQGNKAAPAQQAAEQGRFLSEVQSKLRDQAIALAGRLQLRDLNEENEAFSSFQKDMAAAAQAMSPAADKLHQQKWQDALPNEQKALQHLLQAEATFRQIQVAFGNAGGGGGGGAGRDLASLFDLELDTQKNQYETAQTASSSDERQQQIDDAMKKLDELARRQQELAEQQRNNSAQSFEQRWQQEMLRREAEQLQRQMEQMAQQQQQSASASGSSQSANVQSSSGQASSSQASSGQSQGSSDPRVKQALDRLRQADDAMKRAGSQQQGGADSADARSAADQLREAENLLNSVQQQRDSGKLDSMAREADRLAAAQRDQTDRLSRMLSQQDSSDNSQSTEDLWNKVQGLAQDRQQLADDLAQLEARMRESARELAPGQRDAASKLRDALGDMDQNDLQTRIQRSADWLRRGINPNSNSAESEIAKDLEHLSGQVRGAQQALGTRQGQQDSQSALDRVARLRDQMEALTRDLGERDALNRQQVQLGRDNQPGGQNGGQASGQQSQRAQQGQRGQQPGQQSDQQGGQQSGQQAGNTGGPGGQSAQMGPGGRAMDRWGGASAQGFRDDGYYTGGQRPAGAGRAGWWIDTGNNSNLPQGSTAPDNSALPPDPERTYQQSVSNMNQLLQTFQDDPQEKRDLQNLIQEMQRLNPKRFPGNPALLDQIHNEIINDVNNLELQVQRKLDDKSGQVRSADPMAVPAGYQDAVAEYFRRLSKNP